MIHLFKYFLNLIIIQLSDFKNIFFSLKNKISGYAAKKGGWLNEGKKNQTLGIKLLLLSFLLPCSKTVNVALFSSPPYRG